MFYTIIAAMGYIALEVNNAHVAPWSYAFLTVMLAIIIVVTASPSRYEESAPTRLALDVAPSWSVR
jgi:hypothetical protein